MLNVSCIILASGFSERMGTPKALLRWDSDRCFLEKLISDFHQFGCKSIVCMINSLIEPHCAEMKVPTNVNFVVNQHPEWGRFFSIKSACRELENVEYCFVHNVDNPFVDSSVLKKVFNAKSPEKWCSPCFNGKGGHPVLLPGFIIEEIAQAENLNQALNSFLQNYPRIIVDVESDSIFKNINTPDDYRMFFGKPML